MSNENNKNENVKKLAFSKDEPFAEEAKKEVILMLLHAFENFAEAYDACRAHIHDNVPDFELKRTLALATLIAKSAIESLERRGAAIILDNDLALGILTPYVIPGPGIVSEVGKYFEER